MARILAESESDVIEAVRDARRCISTLEIVGQGTKHGYGQPTESEHILDLSKLTGIVSYEPDELVLTAKAGTTIAEIKRTLVPRAQALGFDPADWGPLFGAPPQSATIGGILSADACGPARVRFGGARDHLLGFRAVNGLGEIYKAGGRVVKNVTGFDLSKLMCGAMGTLGVLTEVTLRLVPRAALQKTLIARNVEPEVGLALLRSAWKSPLAPTGLAYIPACVADVFPEAGNVGAGAAVLRIDGERAAIEEKTAALRALAPLLEPVGIEGNALFRNIGDGTVFVEKPLDVWRVMVPPANAAQYTRATGAPFWLADWAGALLWIGSSQDDAAAAEAIRSAAATLGGRAILMRASDKARKGIGAFPAETKEVAALTFAVKSAFDPMRLFNRGRMVEGV